MNVGFVPTCTMGQPMVANLIRNGQAVLAYDIGPAALEAAAGPGSRTAASAA